MFQNSDVCQHRNYLEEQQRVTEPVNSSVVIRKATPEELERFNKFQPENKMNMKWAVRFK